MPPRRRLLRTGIIVLCLLWAGPRSALAADQRCTQPLSGVPDQWLYLPAQVVDSAWGGYHDALSGAFVGFDGILKGRFEVEHARQRAIEERPDGLSHGSPYRLEMIPSARDYLIAVRRRVFGSAYPEGFPGETDELPLPGARRLKVTFVTKSMEWPFTSDVQDERQERRVRELLIKSTVCGDWPAASLPTLPLSAGVVRLSITLGEDARIVLKRLGQPASVGPAAGDGFRLRYDLRYEPDHRMIELRFGREQHLEEITGM
jgi:hypothetical protein